MAVIPPAQQPPVLPKPTKTLFSIGEDLIALERIIEDADGDISDPKAAEAVESWFKELARDQGTKVDGYVNLIRKWEGQSAAAKAEAEQYRKRAQVRENRVESLKIRLKQHMEATGQQRIETPTGRTVAIQKNGGKTPMNIAADVDPKKVDPKYQVVTTVINAEAVYTALKAGESLPFAQLLPVGTHLRIR
jgi:hypothetical protein